MVLFLQKYFWSKIHYLAGQSQNVFYSVFWLDRYSNSLIILKVNICLDFPRVVSGNAIYCGTIYMQELINLFLDSKRKCR